MSVENVKKFYEAVSQDETLKQKFVELSQKHKGQPMDEAKAMSVMEQEALPIAAQMGYSFTMGDLKAYEVEMQQAKMNRELSDEEMQAVTGGNGGVVQCPLIGVGSGDISGFCFIGGSFRSSSGSHLTCVLVGEGLLY
jgi:bacteriocin-like protein